MASDQQSDVLVGSIESQDNQHTNTLTEDPSRPEFSIDGLYPSDDILYAPPPGFSDYLVPADKRSEYIVARHERDAHLPCIEEDISCFSEDDRHDNHERTRCGLSDMGHQEDGSGRLSSRSDEVSGNENISRDPQKDLDSPPIDMNHLRQGNKYTTATPSSNHGLGRIGLTSMKPTLVTTQANMGHVLRADAEWSKKDNAGFTRSAHTPARRTSDSIGSSLICLKYQMYSDFDVCP